MGRKVKVCVGKHRFFSYCNYRYKNKVSIQRYYYKCKYILRSIFHREMAKVYIRIYIYTRAVDRSNIYQWKVRNCFCICYALPFLNKLQLFHRDKWKGDTYPNVYKTYMLCSNGSPWLSHWTNIASVYATAVYNVECKGNVHDWNWQFESGISYQPFTCNTMDYF